jgi:hypothetical protein
MTRHDTAQHGNAEATQDTGATQQDKKLNSEKSSEIQSDSEHIYTLSVAQVRKMLVDAGHIVSERTLIRWCTKELLDATLRPEENGQYEKYYVTEGSVLKKINQLDRVKPAATQSEPLPSHDQANPGAVVNSQANNISDQDTVTPAQNLSRQNAMQEASEGKASDVHDLRRQVQELNQELSTKNVDIQIRDKLLIREKEATREAWNKIAEIGEQVGKWKMKYEKLELASHAEPIFDSEPQGSLPTEVHEPELLPQIDTDEIIEEKSPSAKHKDMQGESNTSSRGAKLAEKLLPFTLYSIVIALVILISYALYMTN